MSAQYFRVSIPPRMSSRIRRACAPAALLAVLGIPVAAGAATYTVTNLTDSGSGSLRYAVGQANASTGTDTITFSSTLAGTITLSSPIAVTDSISLVGPGANRVTVNGNGAQILNAENVDISVSGLQFVGGAAGNGGAINGRAVTLSSCTFGTNYADNAGGAVLASGPLTADHCTFAQNVAGSWGGGLACYDSASLADCTFTANSGITDPNFGWGAGGAVYAGSVSAARCTFSNNSAAGSGALLANGAVDVTGCTFDSNLSAYDSGGAIFAGGDVSLTGTTFTNNYSGGYEGGAVCSVSSITARQCTFASNAAGNYGGALSSNYIDCTASQFVGNRSGWYGGAVLSGNSGKYTNCIFSNNVCTGYIGGAVCALWTMSATNCAFTGNSAQTGAAVFTICISDQQSKLTNCTIAGNSQYVPATGSSLPFSAVTVDGAAGASVANCIVWGNGDGSAGQQLRNDYSHIAVTSSDVQGWFGATPDVSGNFSADPHFVDPVSGIVRLLFGSPCIDAGNNASIPAGVTTDLDGAQRIYGLRVDMGAYEWHPVSWSGVLQPVNADGTSIFKAGSTIPVKFCLTGDSAGITNLVASLSFQQVSSSVAGPVNEATSAGTGTTGNLFRYDAASGQYIYNWSTKGLAAGTYRLLIDLGDGVSRSVDVGLR